MNENQNNIPNSQEDEYIIGKGFEVEEYKTQPKKQRNKGANTIKNTIWIIAIFVVSIAFAIGVIYIGADYLAIGFNRGNDCVMEIEPGSSTVKIAQQLKEVGAVRSPFAFRVYSKLTGYETQYKYGVYTFSTDAGYEALAQMLTNDGAKAETVRGVQIPEMATVAQIAEILDSKGVCTKKDFIYEVQNGEFDFDFVKKIPADTVYYRLEGYLYPETYDFYSYDSAECAHLAVEKMLSTFESRIEGDTLKALTNNKKYTLHELLTVASLVNSEAGRATDENRAKVARVFYNRLEGVNWNEPKFLQTDPSTHYPHGNGRYNTYTSEGLPPGAIGSPDIRSIKAAVNPAENFTKTYFVTDSNSEFYFNDTLAAHNKIIAELKAKGLWIYTTLG